MHRNRTISRTAVAGAIAAAAGAAGAQTTYLWTGAGDGVSFGMSQNWTPAGVPGSLDEAKFDLAGTRTVSLGQSRSNAVLSVENESVLLNLGGGTYTVAELVVGDRNSDVGVLDVAGGTLAPGSGKATIGKLATSDGTVMISAGARMQCASDLMVGDAGEGTLVIDPGATVTCPIVFVADKPGSRGTLEVRGVLSVAGSALVGNGGVGAALITGGGDMTAGGPLKIGDNDSSSGAVTVSGSGSTLSAGADSKVGNLSPGSLTVSAGAQVTLADLTVGDDAPGTVTVDGASSRLTATSGMQLGNNLGSSGRLTLANGGVVSSSFLVLSDSGTLDGRGTVNAQVQNGGVVRPGAPFGILGVGGGYSSTSGDLEIEIGGPDAGTGYDRLSIAGAAQLGGKLTVSLRNGYDPSSGEFVVVQAGSIGGTFATVVLPPGFEISYEADRVVVGPAGCVADFNGDGAVNTQDVIAFLNAWVAGASSADINGDGAVNTMDVIAYLNLWTAGC